MLKTRFLNLKHTFIFSIKKIFGIENIIIRILKHRVVMFVCPLHS
jgi:hypothetical protein